MYAKPEVQRAHQDAGPEQLDYNPAPANILALENEYVLELEMPGVNKYGLQITLEGMELTVVGRRTCESNSAKVGLAAG